MITTGVPLSDLEKQILDEHDELAMKPPGPRERYIREQMHLSPTRYYQRLNALLDCYEALVYKPVVIHRLRAVREENRRKRQ